MYSTVMRSVPTVLAVVLALATFSFGFEFQDDDPEITDRVARISVIKGEAQVRRSDTDEWEVAVLNLPMVQGDTLATGPDARIELQFDSDRYLRVDENSQVTLTAIHDGGIAVSVGQGSAAIRLMKFDPEREFFEIDAPKTTVAIQRSGHYLVDAGTASNEVRITVTEDGEARVYSESSGFTLRSGRSAQLFIGGYRSGEWELADASQFRNEFAEWSVERDSVIAARLRTAHYDRYYDRDIYGAEELDQYGEWVFTRSYGYVWRPYSSSISTYSDWSPYRYGHWRWVPPYGWTWVNDEPWGWATYHYGRWVWDNGYWYWSPYGQIRNRRSWWRPALVVIGVYNRNICWYPLPYHYGYYNYNRYNRRPRGPRDPGPVSTPTPTTSPTPSASPTPQPPIYGEERRRGWQVPSGSVPVKGVVSLPAEEFGKRRGGVMVPSADTAKAILSKTPDETTFPPILPTYEEIRKQPIDVRADRARLPQPQPTAPVGAATRKANEPLDTVLRRTKIYGDREPVKPVPVTTPDNRTSPGINPGIVPERKTGAVERPPIRATPPVKRDEGPPLVPAPRYEPPKNEPVKRPDPPRYEPPRQEQPKYVPPPVRKDPPRYEPPRADPPRRSEPRQTKSEPPPAKSEPTKPSPPPSSNKKDGR